MQKITYSEEQVAIEKENENLLWKVVWSFEKELGIDNEKNKKEIIPKIEKLIPVFSKLMTELDINFDYPIINIFLTSLHIGLNILEHQEFKKILSIEGPDNNAKIFYIEKSLKERGILWQHKY